MNRRQFSLAALVASISSLLGIEQGKAENPDNLPVIKFKDSIVCNHDEIFKGIEFESYKTGWHILYTRDKRAWLPMTNAVATLTWRDGYCQKRSMWGEVIVHESCNSLNVYHGAIRACEKSILVNDRCSQYYSYTTKDDRCEARF